MSDTSSPEGESVSPYAHKTAPYVMPSGDILAAHDASAPTRRAPWLVAGGVGVLVLALVGGVTYGVGALSGGGSQPENALPSGAFAFVKVDLDPSAGQKVDGFRFLRQFPALRDKLGGDDLRKAVFEEVAEGAGWQDVDFDSEVGPWLGQRVAVAAYPPSSNSGSKPDASPGLSPDGGDSPEPGVVVAVAVTDADGAREGLAKLAVGAGDDGTRLGFVVAGDYALLAETQALAERAAKDAAGSTLAQDGDFSADLADAGAGVMTAWIDAARLTDSLASDPALGMLGAPGMIGGVSGRSTFVARFDGPDAFEVVGRVRGADTAGWASRPVRGLGALPASSVAAVGVADGDELVMRTFASLEESMAGSPEGDAAMMMPSFEEIVREGERALGIELPDDLAALFGDNLVAALDGTESGEIGVGARVSTDVVRAERVLDVVTKASGGNLPLVRRRVGEDLVVASTPAQADRLASVGTLGENTGFSRALPDLDDAHLAVWIDLGGLASAIFGGFGSESAGEMDETDANLAPIEGVGVTVVSGAEGSATFRLRLVTS